LSGFEAGAEQLLRAMQKLADEFGLDSIRVAVRVQDDHLIALTLSKGAPLVIEREDGVSAIVRDFA
jgi:hypothetical protein